MKLLILGAGYIGAALADRALARGDEVVLADNWYATDRAQLVGLEERGARVETADIRNRDDVAALLAGDFDRLCLLAAQASRPIAERDPDYTEETNVIGVRRVAEAVADTAGPPVVFASSLNVYGASPAGHVMPDHPYGAQTDLAHLSKIYGELCLELYAMKASFGLAIFRLGIVYGPSPVSHTREESQTVVDKFRRLAREGKPLSVDDPGRTIGVVHIDDVSAIFLGDPLFSDGVFTTQNVAAETVTVGGLAALARGEHVSGGPAFTFWTPFKYRHYVADYLRPE